MDVENTIKVTLDKDDIEQAIRDYARKEFDDTNLPSFESITVTDGAAVIIYKGYP